MDSFISKFIDKLFVKQWQIGLCRCNIKEIISSKIFNPEINWLSLNTMDYFHADPFMLKAEDGTLEIFVEDFKFEDYYGKIALLTVDNNYNLVSRKIILDTKSHLSYPFIFKENGRIFIFPEAGHSGRLACYEYDPVKQSITFLQEILGLPLLDPTIIKYKNKYWMFGTLIGKNADNKLYIFYSKNLLGPYIPHAGNPVKNALNGSRPAGDFIIINDVVYRPSQNCKNQYGESITINEIKILDELNFVEEPYMLICPTSKNQMTQDNDKILTFHTINVVDDTIVVDGIRWSFSPRNQWKNYLKNREMS